MEQTQTMVLPTTVEPATKRKLPPVKSLPSAKSVQTTMTSYIPCTKGAVLKTKNRKRRKYHIGTYRMMMSASSLCDYDVDEHVNNNKKSLQNKGSRMLARVKKYFTCSTFFLKIWEDYHMLMTMVCVFNKFFSSMNIMAMTELLPMEKDYIMSKIKESAPQSIYIY